MIRYYSAISFLGYEDEKPKTFTQEELNAVITKEKTNWQKGNQKIIDELNQLKQSANLTAEEKQKLQERIETLENENLTEKQKADREQERIKTDYETKLQNSDKERDFWRNSYHSEKKVRDITDAGIEGKAFNPTQIVALLMPNSRLVETVGEDGKPNGQFVTKIKFDDIDSKTKKPVTLDLSPAEAVKRMRELPEVYGNLFKGDANSGLGGQTNYTGNNNKNQTLRDLAKLSPVEFRDALKKNPQLLQGT